MGVKLMGAEVERHGPVGVVKIHPVERMMERSLEPDCDEFVEVHTAIAIGLEQLRFDDSVRVVILTGSAPDVFYRAPNRSHYDVERFRNRLRGIITPELNAELRPSEARARFRRTANYVELMLNYEKPLIARVNGDVIGAGQSVMWGCDMIVAREDAVIADVHTGMGEVVNGDGDATGFPWAVSPGDGAMAFAQHNFSSYKYKEYQMLSPSLTARELAEMHVINYALPADQLDDKLDDLVRRLLARPQSVLQHIRRVTQKPIVAQANLQYDLSWSYEHSDFVTHGLQGHFDPQWSPTMPAEIELPAAVGRPAQPYAE
ncbi:MAG TPA: enoyl-CoA hydratase/isomerase family protein [Conexibacter sp.]|jgi:enoyl-CoA hydratase/carnithine racemase